MYSYFVILFVILLFLNQDINVEKVISLLEESDPRVKKILGKKKKKLRFFFFLSFLVRKG